MTTTPVWPRPPASVRRWMLVAVLLFVVGVVLGAIGLVWSASAGEAFSAADPDAYDDALRAMHQASGAFVVLMTEALVLGGLAIVAALVGLVISVRARRANAGTASTL